MRTGALASRVAVVTGAGSPDGIGMACARRLGAAGATVVVAATTDRVHARAADLTVAGVLAHGVVADLTDGAQARAVVADVVGRFGRLDVLVNNAGMTSTAHGSDVDLPVDEMSDADWADGIARNLSTAFLMTAAAVPHMRAGGFGRIVNISSTTGPVMAMPGQSTYAAAKAGMVGLTRAVALEVAGAGVTVNAVAPGWIATASATDAERAAGMATPVGRPGTPDEVAVVVAALCDPEMSYVTGALVVVDGGSSVVEDRRAGPATS